MELENLSLKFRVYSRGMQAMQLTCPSLISRVHESRNIGEITRLLSR